MTQQELVNELNRIIIGYNINWNMIKNDADRAIMRINAHLGAEFPMMSDIMISPNHRYTITVKNQEIPIFPEKYLLTVVVPFIAIEVLARDEEFTTIYNKYAMDLDNGLFEMFQNEYNKVPYVFRQDPDVGVFFSNDDPVHNHRHDHKHHGHGHRHDHIPEFTFNIHYHFNSTFEPDKPFTIDLHEYEYKSSAIVKDPTFTEFINNITAYKFKGWSLSPTDSSDLIMPGDELSPIKSDVHLYAHWDTECILGVNNGQVYIKDPYKSSISILNIPSYVDGKLVEVIPTEFDRGTKLVYVNLPRNNLTIKTNAFTSKTLQTLILPRYDYLRDYPKEVKIELRAIFGTSISYLYIPYSIVSIDYHGIVGVPLIECEYEARPSGFASSEDTPNLWANKTIIDEQYESPEIKWGVANG